MKIVSMDRRAGKDRRQIDSPHYSTTTLKEDLAMLTEPLTKNGGMNMCYLDGYYARSLEVKWGSTIEKLKRRV